MRGIQRGWQAASALALALVFIPTAAVQAALPEGAGVATAVTGEVTVSHAVSPEPQALRFKDEVFFRDRISTAAHSLARLLLGKKALVTVRELSELQLIDEAGTSTVRLALGKIVIGVARQRMRPGEIVEIRTQNAVAAIRGTVVVAERLIPPGGSDPITRLHVLSGYIDVTTPGNPGAPPLRLVAPSSLTVAGNTMDRPVPLNAAARATLLSDLQPTQPLPTRVLGGLVRGEQARAAGLARIITGDRSRGGERVDVQGSPVDMQAPITPATPSAGPSSSLPSIINDPGSDSAGELYTVRDGSPQNTFSDVLEATNSAVTVGGSRQLSPTANGFVTQNDGVDVALLEASAPLLNLFGAGGSQPTTSGNASDLTSMAKVTNTLAFVADLPGDFRTKGSPREWHTPGRRGSHERGAVHRRADGHESEGHRSTTRGRDREEGWRR
jgi:hypothetical protein